MVDFNKENMKKIFIIITFAVLLYVGVNHLDIVGLCITYILGVISPFIIGGCIAFVLNVPMSFFEEQFFSRYRGKHNKLIQKIKRPASLVLVLILLVAVLFIVLFLIIPEVGSTLVSIAQAIPGFMKDVQAWANELIEWYNKITKESVSFEFNMNWDQIINGVIDFLKSGVTSILGSTIQIATSIVNGVVSFFIAFIFALYMLFQKEHLTMQCKKVLYACMKEARADQVTRIVRMTGHTFSRFLSGQCLEAVILGTLFFVVLTLFQFPYALLIGVMVTILALIPMVGAFIACILGAFLILMVDPTKAIWFVLLFLVLQQVEGNLIYPRVVGNSVGLHPLWVLFAITVGGSLMGIIGMIVFIPLMSVIYVLLGEHVEHRLKVKKVHKEKWEPRK